MKNNLMMLEDFIEILQSRKDEIGNVPVFIYDHQSPFPLTPIRDILNADVIPDIESDKREPIIIFSNVKVEMDDDEEQ